LGQVREGFSSIAMGYTRLAAMLCTIPAVAVALLASMPGVEGWGEALILVAVSSMANLSILPEVLDFRSRHRIRPALVVFFTLQIGLAVAVGWHILHSIRIWQSQIWGPHGLSMASGMDEFLRTVIGVSDVGNLLPSFSWIISFNGVFLSLVTGISYWTTIPATALVVIGYLWQGSDKVGPLGYVFILLLLLSIGFESITGRGKGVVEVPTVPTLVRKRVRAIALAAALTVLLLPLMPDLRGLTPFHDLLAKPTPAGGQRVGTLRFSTLFQFAGNLRLDPSPVLLVQSNIPTYWRGLVFDRYTGRAFLEEEDPGSPHQAGEELLSTYSPKVNSSFQVTQNFTFLANFPGVIFAAFEPRTLWLPDGFSLTKSMVIRTLGSRERGFNYSVVSRVVKPDPDLLRAAGRAQGDRRYVQLAPTIPSRVEDLARNLTSGLGDDFDRAVAVARYLKAMRYDLDVPDTPPERDVVDYFLFESRRGYCQHFAAAMTILLRELGIPARVVTGFGSGSFDPSIGAYRVYEYNFHAWVEVKFAGFGWVAFDPTPGSVGGPNIADAAERYAIFDGVLPFRGSVEKKRTVTRITDVPEYVSVDQPFLIEGVVREMPGSRGAARVPINVTVDTRNVSFPAMVMAKREIPILLRSTDTMADGTFLALCNLPPVLTNSTEARIRVICRGDDLHESSEVDLSLPILISSRIELSFKNASRGLLIARLTSPLGPISGAEIQVYQDSEELGTWATNSSGIALIEIEPLEGPHVIVARFGGRGRLGSSSAVLRYDQAEKLGGKRGPVVPWTLAFAVLAVVFSLLFILRRRRADEKTILGVYRGMLLLLSRRGLARPRSLTPYEYLSWLEERGLEGVEHVRKITDRFVEAAYAHRRADNTDLSEARLSLLRLRAIHGPKATYTRYLRRWGRSVIGAFSPLRM